MSVYARATSETIERCVALLKGLVGWPYQFPFVAGLYSLVLFDFPHNPMSNPTDPPDLKRVLSKNEFRAAVTGSYSDVRAEFERHFGPGIENFVLLSHKVYSRIQTMSDRVPYDDRSAWTYQFLYVALNDLISAFHLQISGFVAPAGNLMRQFGEAMALGILCSHDGIDVFDRVTRERTSFPAHKAINLLKNRRNRSLLDLDESGLEDLERITKFYDALSHAGVFGASALQVFGVPGAKALGGAFDPAKFSFYEREIRLSHTGAMRLMEAVLSCEGNLNRARDTGSRPRNST